MPFEFDKDIVDLLAAIHNLRGAFGKGIDRLRGSLRLSHEGDEAHTTGSSDRISDGGTFPESNSRAFSKRPFGKSDFPTL
jgi:hypothetical protein